MDLWLKILDIMDRLMNSGQGDSLVRTPTLSLALMANPLPGRTSSRKPEEYAARHVQQRLLGATTAGPGAREVMAGDVEKTP